MFLMSLLDALEKVSPDQLLSSRELPILLASADSAPDEGRSRRPRRHLKRSRWRHAR
jgi:hypothetical protein